MSTLIFQIQSTIIVSLMIFGVIKRRTRSLHTKIMRIVITWDVLLILQIELNRSAIMKASKAMTNPMLLNIHVSIAISTVVFYGLMIYTGSKILKGDNTYRQKHKKLGLVTFLLRMSTYVTSFLI